MSKLVAVAVHAARAEAATAKVAPESTDALDANGYPVMWAITWRARRASWDAPPPALLEQAFT
ncbi:MAG: hypothetical protein ACYDEN_03810 [Acidimicrobiales bacterium]